MVFSVPAAFADSTMSWDFELYNQPYAEQTALTIAQAQKQLEKAEEDPFARWDQDPLERFKEMLTQQILYKLSRSVVDEIFGEGTLEPGTYTVGNYEIVIMTDGITVIITITDTETGNTTTIEIPYYNYGGGISKKRWWRIIRKKGGQNGSYICDCWLDGYFTFILRTKGYRANKSRRGSKAKDRNRIGTRECYYSHSVSGSVARAERKSSYSGI